MKQKLYKGNDIENVQRWNSLSILSINLILFYLDILLKSIKDKGKTNNAPIPQEIRVFEQSRNFSFFVCYLFFLNFYTHPRKVSMDGNRTYVNFD